MSESTNHASSEELRGLQKKSLEILGVFKEFCDRHGLLFYFCGGCCIGTIRHGGFIPWDDDIDVFMPRPDYEKLTKLWPEEMGKTRYRFCRSDENTFYRSLLSYISDEETTFIKERQADLDISHGVRLEILPLDGCPDSRLRRKLQIFWGLTYQLFMNQEAPTSKGRALELAGRAALALFPTWRRRYRIAKFAERKMSRYPFASCEKTTELCARYKYMVNEYPHAAFEKAVYRPFEGVEMPIPQGYDTYLHMAFGDYMALPPESEQIPKHEAVLVDLEHSYRIYRGKYYLTGTEEKE
jgi:lipopolysaccharide cholinephosphotransferase